MRCARWYMFETEPKTACVAAPPADTVNPVEPLFAVYVIRRVPR